MGLGIKSCLKWTGATLKYLKSISGITVGPSISPLLLCHSLEKGMGISNVKKGYGKAKAEKLIAVLKEMKQAGKSNDYEFCEALAILKAYFAYHEADGTDVSELKKQAAELIDGCETSYNGGYQILQIIDLMEGTKADFEKLVMSRHSMRTYSQEPISQEELEQVISLAKRAPSACNREPWKFYTSLDTEKCRQIAAAVPPQSFLEEIPYFGVVTADRSLFYSHEMNQWYVNGGIFLGYLALAFHSQGIGSCIFQFPALSETAEKLRRDFGIPMEEDIIAVVVYGHFADEMKYIYADRRPNDMILKIK